MKAHQSLNFWTSIVSFVIAAVFTSQGIEVNVTSEEIAHALLTKEGIGLALFLGMNLYTPILKTYRRVIAKEWIWAALLSKNLVAHLTSAVAVIVGIWLDEQEAGFVVAMLTQALNFVVHRWGSWVEAVAE